MTTQVEKSIVVNVPVRTAYNQWTQFEEFPEFMGGLTEVRQLDDRRLHFVAEIAGVKREWEAAILEQVPDRKVAWAATAGATNAGAVYFEPISSAETSVRLSLEYEPEGVIEKVGDKLNIVAKQAESDLERFKAFIESRGAASGAWRGGVDEGAVGTPGVDAARASEGDSGKAGLSGKVVAGAAAAAVAGVAAAGAAKARSGEDTPEPADVPTDYPASPIVEQPAPTVSTTAPTVATTAPDVPPVAAPMGVPATDLAFSAEERETTDPDLLLDRDPDLPGRGAEGAGR